MALSSEGREPGNEVLGRAKVGIGEREVKGVEKAGLGVEDTEVLASSLAASFLSLAFSNLSK